LTQLGTPFVLVAPSLGSVRAAGERARSGSLFCPSPKRSTAPRPRTSHQPLSPESPGPHETLTPDGHPALCSGNRLPQIVVLAAPRRTPRPPVRAPRRAPPKPPAPSGPPPLTCSPSFVAGPALLERCPPRFSGAVDITTRWWRPPASGWVCWVANRPSRQNFAPAGPSDRRARICPSSSEPSFKYRLVPGHGTGAASRGPGQAVGLWLVDPSGTDPEQRDGRLLRPARLRRRQHRRLPEQTPALAGRPAYGRGSRAAHRAPGVPPSAPAAGPCPLSTLRFPVESAGYAYLLRAGSGAAPRRSPALRRCVVHPGGDCSCAVRPPGPASPAVPPLQPPGPYALLALSRPILPGHCPPVARPLARASVFRPVWRAD